MADLMDKLTIDDLPGEQRDIARVIGLEGYKKLVRYVNGDSVYICKEDEVLRSIRDNEILRKFNGYNYRELADKYNLTPRSIRRILEEAAVNRPQSRNLYQYTMFDKNE